MPEREEHFCPRLTMNKLFVVFHIAKYAEFEHSLNLNSPTQLRPHVNSLLQRGLSESDIGTCQFSTSVTKYL